MQISLIFLKKFFLFLFRYKDSFQSSETEKYALLSTSSSAKVIAVFTLLLEIGFVILTVVNPSLYGNYIWYYRACYFLFILNCVTLFITNDLAKKNIDKFKKLVKITNCISVTIFLLWAVSISYLDQLNGYSTSPIILMSMILCVVASIYITPLFFVIIDLCSNLLFILIMVIGMKRGVTLGEIVNFSVYAGVSLIVCLTFIYNRYRYYSEFTENIAVKVKAEETEELLEQTTMALALTIDAKDKYTNGHSVRVAQYSRMIAERLNLDEQTQKDIYYKGLLHDVGKIGVPGDIIHKESSLSSKEYDVIKQHPSIGGEILSTIKAMPSLSEGALFHHECFDGSGYPFGYEGNQIPLSARIICVADSYDAMTSTRSYRETLTQKKAKEELLNGRGTQFDPQIVDVMLALIDEDKNFELREKILK